MTESTTQQMIRTQQEEADKRRFFLTHEEFVLLYSPDDPDEAARFTARLTHLMRETARDAQRPFVDAAAQAMASRPSTPVVLPEGMLNTKRS